MYVLLIEGCLCTEVAHMLMKDPKENPVISREPLLNSMKEKNEDFMKDTKKIIARRRGRRRGKGPKVEKFQVEKRILMWGPLLHAKALCSIVDLAMANWGQSV